MKSSKNIIAVACLAALVAATYFGFGAANQANTAQAEAKPVEDTKEAAALGAQNQTQGDAFLASNKTTDGVVTTQSGLQYQVIREGIGEQPLAENTVKVHYSGTLIDDTIFDSSYQRDQPADFPVDEVIPGLFEGLQLMKEGAKYRFVIPAAIAYGSQGTASIGPNQVLIFEIELLDVL